MTISKLKHLLQCLFIFITLIFSSCEKIVGITTENCSSIERFWVRSTPDGTTYWDFNNNQHGGVIKGEYKNGDCNITDGFLLIWNLADTLILSKDNKLDTFRLNLTCKSMTLSKVVNKKSNGEAADRKRRGTAMAFGQGNRHFEPGANHGNYESANREEDDKRAVAIRQIQTGDERQGCDRNGLRNSGAARHCENARRKLCRDPRSSHDSSGFGPRCHIDRASAGFRANSSPGDYVSAMALQSNCPDDTVLLA